MRSGKDTVSGAGVVVGRWVFCAGSKGLGRVCFRFAWQEPGALWWVLSVWVVCAANNGLRAQLDPLGGLTRQMKDERSPTSG